MYITLIVTVLLLLAIVIGSIQNTMSIDLKFILWEYKTSVTVLIFYSSLIGAAIVAVLTLPKLTIKSFKLRRLNREINVLKRRSDMEKKEEIAPTMGQENEAKNEASP